MISKSKILVFCIYTILSFTVFSNISNSQNDSADISAVPVTPLNELRKFSIATVKNNLYHEGKVFGYVNGESKYINEIYPQQTFSFTTENFDSIQFYYEWNLNEQYRYVVDKFFLRVLDNQPFRFETVPIQDLTGLEMVVANIKKYKGKKLYDLKIIDDVDPGQIEVSPTIESSPYIEIIRIDSSLYQVKLKGIYEFNRDVGNEIKENIKKGKEVILPIGIVMRDKVVKDDVQEYKIFLKKKKKLNTKN